MMPGPSRFYASNAARQRAYRRRRQEEAQGERDAAQQTTAYAYAIQAAVASACKAGDPLAAAVYRPEAFATLRALADHFYDQAETPAAARPWLER